MREQAEGMSQSLLRPSLSGQTLLFFVSLQLLHFSCRVSSARRVALPADSPVANAQSVSQPLTHLNAMSPKWATKTEDPFLPV